MLVELLDFLFSLMPMSDSWKGIVCLTVLFFGGWFAGARINPVFGLLILAAAFVVDFVISTNGPGMDKVPVTIEAIAYGVIALGWMINGTISAVRRDNIALERAEKEGT